MFRAIESDVIYLEPNGETEISLPLGGLQRYSTTRGNDGSLAAEASADGIVFLTSTNTVSPTDMNVNGALIAPDGTLLANIGVAGTSAIESGGVPNWIDASRVRVTWNTTTPTGEDPDAGIISALFTITRTSTSDATGDVIDFSADDLIDRMFGGAGGDLLRSGGNDDTLTGGLGPDLLDGGSGSDAADYSDDFGAVFVNLTTGDGFGNAAQGDTFFMIENVTGSVFDDFLIGNAGVNQLDGRGGNDTLIGGENADMLIGGTGIDTASYEGTSATVVVNLALRRGFNNSAEGDVLSGIENVTGGYASDYLIGDAGANILIGGFGNDLLIGGLGADVLDGGDGTDTASYEDNQGEVRVVLESLAGFGNAAEGDALINIENLIGTAFNDTLIGDDGRNNLSGGAGDDALDGGKGFDRLIGGAGSDVFVFVLKSPDQGADIVMDFTPGVDRIQLLVQNLVGAREPRSLVILGTELPATSVIIYSPSSGQILYDQDGSGILPAMPFAAVRPDVSLSFSDFIFS